MKTNTLAALLWWVDYIGGGTTAFDNEAKSLEYVESNFVEWTESAAERNRWRKIAASMKAQARPIRLVR